MPYNPKSAKNLNRAGRPKTKAGIVRFRLAQPAIDWLNQFPNKTKIVEALIMNATQHPPELWASDEFCEFPTILTPEQYQEAVESCIDADFGEDFDPAPQKWDLVDPVNGIYETIYCYASGGKHRQQKKRAKMAWNEGLGTFKAEDME